MLKNPGPGVKHKKFKKLPKIHPTIQAAIAAALFFLGVWLSRGADMKEWEISVFQALYYNPVFIKPAVIFITQTGSIYMLGLLLFIFTVRKQWHVVIRLLLTATLAYQLSGFAKDIWGRARPHEVLPGIYNLDYVVRGPGFPSGHTALAVAMALVVGHYLPKQYRWLTIVWIGGVAFSRLYLGIHAPLDILGGFAIGWFSYALFRHVRLQDIRYGKRKPAKQ